jgi:hypothetical protein
MERAFVLARFSLVTFLHQNGGKDIRLMCARVVKN